MPVYGQPTEFNERLCSLMSAIIYNSNKIYDSGHNSHHGHHHYHRHTTTIRNYRPLFTNSILQKSAALEGMKRPKSAAAGAATIIVIEVVLVVTAVADDDDSIRTCRLLAKLISQFFAMPDEDNPYNCHQLKVITVRSQSIR